MKWLERLARRILFKSKNAQREKVLAKARQIRRLLGLEPDWRLGSD